MVNEVQIIGYRVLKAKDDKPERFMLYTVQRDQFVKGVCFDCGNNGFNNSIFYIPSAELIGKDDLLSLEGFDFFKRICLLIIDQPFGISEKTYSINLLDYKK